MGASLFTETTKSSRQSLSTTSGRDEDGSSKERLLIDGQILNAVRRRGALVGGCQSRVPMTSHEFLSNTELTKGPLRVDIGHRVRLGSLVQSLKKFLLSTFPYEGLGPL